MMLLQYELRAVLHDFRLGGWEEVWGGEGLEVEDGLLGRCFGVLLVGYQEYRAADRVHFHLYLGRVQCWLTGGGGVLDCLNV